MSTIPTGPQDPPSVATLVPAGRIESKPVARGRKVLQVGMVTSSDAVLHQGFFSLADQAVASATNFLTGIIIARSCSKEELGLYMLGFSVILLVNDLQTSLIATPYMIYAPRLKGRAHALYTGSSLIHQLALSLFTVVALVCGAAAVTMGVGPRGIGPVLWALCAVSTLTMLREYARRVSFARLKIMTAFFLDSLVAAVQISGLLLLAHSGRLSASRAYWVVGLACGVAVAAWLWLNRKVYDPRMDQALSDFKKNWLLGKWVFASGLVVAVTMNLYPWFIAYFHGTASAGVWAACLGVVSVGNPALLGIQNLVGPKIAHSYAAAGPKAFRRLVLKITAAVAVAMSLLCLALIIWGDRLIALLYGHDYAGNAVVVTILALNTLVIATAFPITRALYAIGRADLDFLGNLAGVFIMLSAGLWLVRVIGMPGAALGLLGSGFVTSAAKAGAFLRVSGHIPEN